MRQHLSVLILSISVLFGLLNTGSATAGDDESTPKVYLNHFFLNVDSSTYKDIVASDFIKNEFAHFEERTTVVNNDESYTGAYVYGENTYFEFFEESNSQDFMPIGLTSGMAFGVEKPDIMTWVMEYHEDFLKKWHPDLDPSSPGNKGIKMSCHSNQHKKEIFAFGENSRLVLHADNTATWVF